MTAGILWAVPTTTFPATPNLGGTLVEHCHHVTLGMGELSPEWTAAIGIEFEAAVSGTAWCDTIGAEALVVKLPDHILPLVKTTKQQEKLGGYRPHSTLFTREGVGAFKSNAMLAGEYQQAPASISSLRLRVEFCPNEEMTEQAKISFRQQP